MVTKKVYISLIADLLHAGHINVLKEAARYGEVTVGLLTSSAINELDDIAYLKYQQRLDVINSLSMVSSVVPQEEASYKKNITKIKPNFVIHGDDWKNGKQSKYRKEVINILREWGGELIEVPYSSDISDQNLKNQLMKLGVTTVHRLGRLRSLIKVKPTIRILEAHNALSALIAENTTVERNGESVSFDGVWSSSLTDSTAKGKPDIEALDITSRLDNINNIFEVTNKPLIIDFDTGGKPEHFAFAVKSMERLGISAVIIEDKTGLKKNSLFGNDVPQMQDSIEDFCHKIQSGVSSRRSRDFLIIARIESLILEAGMDDALKRAMAYVEAGADAIMIHSRQKEPDEIFEFADSFRKNFIDVPLVCVPTSYNHVYEHELEKHGINVVIYANHLMRSAYPAMVKTAEGILKDGSSDRVSREYCMPIKEILELIPGGK